MVARAVAEFAGVPFLAHAREPGGDQHQGQRVESVRRVPALVRPGRKEMAEHDGEVGHGTVGEERLVAGQPQSVGVPYGRRPHGGQVRAAAGLGGGQGRDQLTAYRGPEVGVPDARPALLGEQGQHDVGLHRQAHGRGACRESAEFPRPYVGVAQIEPEAAVVDGQRQPEQALLAQ